MSWKDVLTSDCRSSEMEIKRAGHSLRQKDHKMEGLADDVASVALDVMMAESGLTRRGTNFFLF